MASQRKRFERALRGCAEAGVPESVDLWPAVEEQVAGGQAGPGSAEQRDAGAGSRRRRLRFPRLVPNTLLGWTLAAVSGLILGVGIYAAAEPARELYRRGLPGAAEPGSEKAHQPVTLEQVTPERVVGRGVAISTRLFQQELPGDEDLSLAENPNQTVSRDGASVTLEWAYADTDVVVLGFSVRDLEKDRRNAGNPATLEPIFVSKEDEDVPSAPDLRSGLTDEAGRHFGSIGGVVSVPSPGAGPEEVRAPKAQTAVFEAPEGLEDGRLHDFRLDVVLEETAVAGSMAEAEKGHRSEPKPPIGPLTLDFRVPVRSVPVVEVDQEVTVDGVTLTLDRVVNSPSRPEAEICIDPPNADYSSWRPSMAQVGYASDEPPTPRAIGNGCWSMGLGDPVSGRSSVTVTEITGDPKEFDPDEPYVPKTIRGPWTFEFEAPQR